MWQRIQTLYLFLSLGLTSSLFFCKLTAEKSFTDYVPYFVLLIIIALLSLLALTCYKHRVFQMRTAMMAALITLGFQAWIAVEFFTTAPAPFYITAVFPIAAIILDLLAARNILADEMMVRSASRLRSSKKKK